MSHLATLSTKLDETVDVHLKLTSIELYINILMDVLLEMSQHSHTSDNIIDVNTISGY